MAPPLCHCLSLLKQTDLKLSTSRPIQFCRRPQVPNKAMAGKISLTNRIPNIETWLNMLLQRLFPAWYAVRYAREMKIGQLGELNPRSFLCHRWLSLPAIHASAAEALENAGPLWQEAATLLSKITRHKVHKRYLSITNLLAIESCDIDQDYPNMVAFAEALCSDKVPDSADDFSILLNQTFNEQNAPFAVAYRELDGRYYYKNQDDGTALGALLLACRDKGRDVKLNCEIEVESCNEKVLETLRARYWVLLMPREAAYQLNYLIREAKLQCQIAEFEWRRSDLVFLVLKRNHPRLNDIAEAICHSRMPLKVLDWGRFLSSHQVPFRNR